MPSKCTLSSNWPCRRSNCRPSMNNDLQMFATNTSKTLEPESLRPTTDYLGYRVILSITIICRQDISSGESFSWQVRLVDKYILIILLTGIVVCRTIVPINNKISFALRVKKLVLLYFSFLHEELQIFFLLNK